jgi:hypothetical protein
MKDLYTLSSKVMPRSTAQHAKGRTRSVDAATVSTCRVAGSTRVYTGASWKGDPSKEGTERGGGGVTSFRSLLFSFFLTHSKV